jgi:5-hydroxyisourate hydrolase-like protein (transthyretin family)
VLADRIALQTGQPGPFGAAKVIPNVAGAFRADQSMLVFFQLTNFQVDPSQSAPALTSEVKVTRGAQEVRREQLKIDASNGQNQDRLDLVHELDLNGLETGKYELTLHGHDELSGQDLERKLPFQITKPLQTTKP